MSAWLMNVFSVLAGSTCVWIVVVLSVFDCAIKQYRPLKEQQIVAFAPLDQNPAAGKLKKFFESKTNPDVLLLGSSLTLVPAAKCDQMIEHRVFNEFWNHPNYINSYDKALYFEKLLSAQAHRNVEIVNLATIANMMSDNYLILERSLSQGKRPALVVCEIAPRLFQDNLRNKIEQTPIFQTLGNFDNAADMLLRQAPLAETADFSLSTISYYYKTKADYRSFISKRLAQATGHPESLLDSVKQKSAKEGLQQSTAINTQTNIATQPNNEKPGLSITALKPFPEKANTLEDLDFYRQTYLPANKEQFKLQQQYLHRLVGLARDNAVPIVFVNMPANQANTKILAQSTLTNYNKLIKELKRQPGLVVLEVDTPMALSDFTDSIHLNAFGGMKYYTELTAKISKESRLWQPICARDRYIGQR